MLTIEYLWVFLLLPLPWMIHKWAPPAKRQWASVRVPFGNRLTTAVGKDIAADVSIDLNDRWLFPSCVWLCILFALARPKWIEPPIVREEPTRDLLLLVDLSGSMEQKDFRNRAGKKVDRLTAVKEVLGDFLEKRKGDRVGLVVFGDAAYLQAPFSTDLALSRELLDECEVGMAGPRTALGDAIGLGVGLFDESKAPSKTIIALTDGNDTKSHLPPVEAARVAETRDIIIHTVAIGDPTTVGEDKLDEQALKEVSSATSGSYFFAADRQSLAGIYDELDKLETHQVKTISYRPRSDIFHLPLILALVLSVIEKIIEATKINKEQQSTPAVNVHVNPLTGELEVAA